jgi:hypothetical protein
MQPNCRAPFGLDQEDRREIARVAAFTAAAVATTELVQLGVSELRRWMKRQRKARKAEAGQ